MDDRNEERNRYTWQTEAEPDPLIDRAMDADDAETAAIARGKRTIELSPADELELTVDRTGARLGVLVYYDVNSQGKAEFNILFAQDPTLQQHEVLMAFQGLAKGVLTHHQRLQAAIAREKRGGIILPGEN